MTHFPLVRTKWTNEHVMAALFGVLILYNLPVWVKQPSGILSFLAVTAVALLVDAGFNIKYYKRPMCGVSAAVTAGILYTLASSVPTQGLIFGVIAAIAFGKHAFGGTGKNILNPAVFGFLVIALLFQMINIPLWSPSWLVLPGLLLSLPFLLVRPYAGMGLMLGILLQLFLRQELTLESIVSHGVLFWGALVITDPVTTSPKPYYGSVAGFLAGFMMMLFPSAVSFATAILAFNFFSFLVDKWVYQPIHPEQRGFKIKMPVYSVGEKVNLLDLTADEGSHKLSPIPASASEVISVIKANEIFGMGGAGFPTWKKLETLVGSEAQEKHLIINGVECDPGLIHDKWLLNNKLEDIEKGMMLLNNAFKFSSATLAVKDIGMRHLAEPIKVRVIPDFYPAGAEKVLVKEVLGINLDHASIPAQKGILVLNLQTVLSIYEAVCLGKKADSRYLTVSNLFTREAKVVKVKLGDKIRKILEAAFPNSVNAYFGGGIMQAHPSDDEDIVTKTVNYIATGSYPRYKESPFCSKCSLCSQHCPQGLEVRKIASCVQEGDMGKTRKHHPERCISCGVCSYVCLAGRNLCTSVNLAKEHCMKAL